MPPGGPLTTFALLLAGLLAFVCVVYVARPFLAEPDASPESDRLSEPSPLDRRRIELLEERDRALATLKELEFDHRTGKLSDDDYRALVGPFRRRAAEALQALEPRAAGSSGSARDGGGSRDPRTRSVSARSQDA